MKNPTWLTLFFAAVLPTMATFAQPPPAEDPAAVPPAQPAAAVPADLPPGAAEAVRLSEAGTSEDVLLSFVRNSNSRFNLSADQILYLRDIGFSSTVISAMLNREHELQNQPQKYTYDQRLYPPANPVNPSAVAPQPVAVAPQEEQPQQQPPPPPAQPTVAAQPTFVSNPPTDVSYFYDQLSPYGTWVELDGVGWCWQPRVVVINRAWRPYCDAGYWVYSDAGWYWQSTYSWGWAPFHYGRWQLHPRCGWVWLPDRVWGPSWVVWRSESDHCGWAPLPPRAVFDVGIGWRFNGVRVGLDFDFGLRADHFTFIAVKDFTNHDLGHRRLPPVEVTRVYNHTTIINNYTVNNRTIVNQGIKVDRVAAATHSQIRTVAIRDVPAGRGSAPRTQTPGRSDSVVYRPQLAPPTRRAPMVAQKVDDKHPVVQHDPIATTTPQRPPTTRTGSSAWAGASSKPQPTDNGRSYQRPTNPSQMPTQGGVARPATPAATPASPPPTTRPANRPADRADTMSRPANPQPSTGSQSSPSRAARLPQQPRSSAEYYPKSYRQAAEIHALPPANPRPDPSGSSQPDSAGSRGRKN